MPYCIVYLYSIRYIYCIVYLHGISMYFSLLPCILILSYTLHTLKLDLEIIITSVMIYHRGASLNEQHMH